MKKVAASLIALIAIAQLLPAASYEELLASALAANGSRRKLEAGAERAEIAYKQAELARLSSAIKVQSGTTSATLASSGLVAAAAPSASVGFAGGASLGLGSSLWLSPAGLWASGSGELGIPLARGTDEKLLASRAARQAYALAEAARLRGGLEIELALDEALSSAFQAEVALRSALRAQATAQRELDRAVKIDGAEKGGSTYASLSRALRGAARSSRDALAARGRAFAALRRIVSDSSIPDEALLPRGLPEVALVELPSPGGLSYKAAAAAAAARLGRETVAEKAKRTSLEAVAGASYGLGAAETAAAAAATTTGSSLLGGLGLSAGLKAALGRSGITVEAGLGWQESAGPSASVSVSWSPSPRGGEELRDRDDELELELLELELEDARREAAADAEGLATSRASLEEAAADAAEDFAYAEADLADYGAARDSGFVSEADYGEAVAVRDECAARVLSVKLDRITLNVRAALATAGAEAFEGLR